MSIASIERAPFRQRLLRIADGFAIAIVAVFPWSISVALILIVLWLIAVVMALRPTDVLSELATPAGGLPVALVAAMFCGMLWADADWLERLGSAAPYVRLLAIPLLLAQFRRSSQGHLLLGAYIASCSALLALSWIFAVWPQSAFLSGADFAVPVKNAAAQSGEFVICSFALFFLAAKAFSERRFILASALFAFGLIFLANIFFVLLSLEAWFLAPVISLIVIPILLLLLVLKLFGRKAFAGVFAGLVIICLAGGAYLSHSQSPAASTLESAARQLLWVGPDRPVFWSKSLRFLSEAPIIGHGTGSTRNLFAREAIGQSGVAAMVTINPQQQTLAVAIQLGMIGILLLWGMWLSHLLLFQGSSLAHWVGLVIVTHNIIGSMLNSHLVDFTQAWTYIFGVGVAGGVARQSQLANKQRTTIPSL